MEEHTRPPSRASSCTSEVSIVLTDCKTTKPHPEDTDLDSNDFTQFSALTKSVKKKKKKRPPTRLSPEQECIDKNSDSNPQQSSQAVPQETELPEANASIGLIPACIQATLSEIRDMCDYSSTGGGDKKRWRSSINKLIDNLETQLGTLLHDSVATKRDLQDLYNQNDQKLSELNDKLDNLQRTITSNESHSHPQRPSFAEVVKAKPEHSTLVVKSSDNTSLGQLKQNLTNITCPTHIIVKNFKTKPNHFEIRTNNSNGKDELKQIITQNIPSATVEDKRPRTIKLIFHNANRIDPTAFKNTLQDMGFDDEDIPDFDHPNKVKSKSEGDEHWILTLHRAKALNTILRSYSKDKPNFIHVGFQRLYFRHYVRLIRCRNCQELDKHPSFSCRNPSYCENCGEKNCRNQPCTLSPTCINCYRYNGRLPAYRNSNLTPRNPNHKSSDPSCPTFRQGLINKINNQDLDFMPTEQQETREQHPAQKQPSTLASHSQQPSTSGENLNKTLRSGPPATRLTERVFTSTKIPSKDFLPSFVSSQPRFA